MPDLPELLKQTVEANGNRCAFEVTTSAEFHELAAAALEAFPQIDSYLPTGRVFNEFSTIYIRLEPKHPRHDHAGWSSGRGVYDEQGLNILRFADLLREAEDPLEDIDIEDLTDLL